MATRKQKTASVTVTGTGEDAKTFIIRESAEKSYNNAQYALDEFEREEYIEYTDYEDQLHPTYYIPFHAVDHIVVTETKEDATKPDAYGCEE